MIGIKIILWIIIYLFFSHALCCAEENNIALQKISLIEQTEKITFSAECRKLIESKYAETGKNNLFWEKLPEAVNAIQINAPETKSFGIKELKCFLETRWVEVQLRSIPVMAKVYFKEKNNSFSDFSYEGETPLHRKYLAGTYSFKLDADGYQSEQVEIIVPADSMIVKKTIRLQKNVKQ